MQPPSPESMRQALHIRTVDEYGVPEGHFPYYAATPTGSRSSWDERVRQALHDKKALERAETHPEFFEGWGFHDDWDGWIPTPPRWVMNAYVAGLVHAERKKAETDVLAAATS